MKKFSVFLILLSLTQPARADDLVELKRRAFLFGAGAVLITTVTPGKKIADTNSNSHIEGFDGGDQIRNFFAAQPSRFTYGAELRTMLGFGESEGRSEATAPTRQKYGLIEPRNFDIPKNLHAGWNSVSFSGPNLNPIPGLIRVLKRDLFDSIREYIKQGELQTPKQVIQAIEKMDEESCTPKLEPQHEPVSTVLIIEDGKDE